MKSRRQALKLCLDTAVVIVIEIFNAFTLEVFHGVEILQRRQHAERQAKKYRRLADNSLDADNRRRYEARAEEWENAVAKNGGSGIIRDIDDMLIPVTEESIKSVPLVQIPNWSDEMCEALREAHRDLLKEAAKHPLGTEVASVHDMSMRRIGGIIVGENKSVIIPDLSHAYIALHTHPSGLILSPSDIVQFACRDNLKTLTAVGNDGATYMISKMNSLRADEFSSHIYRSLDRLDKFIQDENIIGYVQGIDTMLKESERFGVQYIKRGT